jgi:hypothetical protein
LRGAKASFFQGKLLLWIAQNFQLPCLLCFARQRCQLGVFEPVLRLLNLQLQSCSRLERFSK